MLRKYTGLLIATTFAEMQIIVRMWINSTAVAVSLAIAYEFVAKPESKRVYVRKNITQIM